MSNSFQGALAVPASDRTIIAHTHCRIITDEAGFDALRPAWEELSSHTADSSPFCSWIWARNWWRHYQAHLAPEQMRLRLQIVCIYDGGDRLIGLAPLYSAVPAHPSWRLASFRQIGSRLLGTQEDLAEEPALLLHENHEEEALGAFMDQLSAMARTGTYDYFTFRYYEQASDAPSMSQVAALKQRCVPLKREELPVQMVALSSDWDQFMRGLSKSMRDNVKYYPRLLTRHGHAWEIETITQPDAVRDAAPELVDLHRRRSDSARGIAHVSHLPTELQAGFLTDTLHDLAKQGAVSLLRLRVAGEVVASLSVLHYKRTIAIFYSGFDPEWYNYSPILILTAEALRQAMAQGDTSANFLPGESAWKERWGVVSDRTMIQETLLLRHPRALARAAFDYARRKFERSGSAPSGSAASTEAGEQESADER